MLIISLVILLLIVFVSLILILKRIITRNVISATQHLEELSKDYQKKQYHIEEKLKELEQQAKAIISQAKQEAETLKAQIIQEAEAQQEKIITSARTQAQEVIQQAERSRQALISEIEERIEKEAVQKACDLIRDTLPLEFKEAVHKYWLDDLLKEGFEGITRLNIPEDIREIEVISAFSLTDGQKSQIIEKLKEILKREIDLKERTDPDVVAGIIINIGSLVLDGSLRFKIRQNAQRLKTK